MTVKEPFIDEECASHLNFHVPAVRSIVTVFDPVSGTVVNSVGVPSGDTSAKLCAAVVVLTWVVEGRQAQRGWA